MEIYRDFPGGGKENPSLEEVVNPSDINTALCLSLKKEDVGWRACVLTHEQLQCSDNVALLRDLGLVCVASFPSNSSWAIRTFKGPRWLFLFMTKSDQPVGEYVNYSFDLTNGSDEYDDDDEILDRTDTYKPKDCEQTVVVDVTDYDGCLFNCCGLKVVGYGVFSDLHLFGDEDPDNAYYTNSVQLYGPWRLYTSSSAKNPTVNLGDLS